MGILNTLEIVCSVLEHQAEVHLIFVLCKHCGSFAIFSCIIVETTEFIRTILINMIVWLGVSDGVL